MVTQSNKDSSGLQVYLESQYLALRMFGLPCLMALGSGKADPRSIPIVVGGAKLRYYGSMSTGQVPGRIQAYHHPRAGAEIRWCLLLNQCPSMTTTVEDGCHTSEPA